MVAFPLEYIQFDLSRRSIKMSGGVPAFKGVYRAICLTLNHELIVNIDAEWSSGIQGCSPGHMLHSERRTHCQNRHRWTTKYRMGNSLISACEIPVWECTVDEPKSSRLQVDLKIKVRFDYASVLNPMC
ncbi:hypothetical protein BJY04DRAFT_86521 [Aspergillus karnatakaensis]|uniref:uncharacterized protein n=1 Tax=Aspergillus karnatakaensis TaxID=1810916 RepID=UPI003CCD32E3